jgi:hypothetical protein
MENSLRRRAFIEVVTGGVLVAATKSTTSLATEAPKLAIDRSDVNWGKRPMYLRPYHPTYLVCYYARRFEKKDAASSNKWNPLVARVENEPDLKIHIVECFDDACAGCKYLYPDTGGTGNQAHYEKGLDDLKLKYGLQGRP